MKYLITICIVLVIKLTFAQSAQYKLRVYIPKGHCCILKKSPKKLKTKKVRLSSDVTFKSSKTTTIDSIDYTGDLIVTRKAGDVVETNAGSAGNDIPYDVPQTLNANITQSKDTLWVNFWVIPPRDRSTVNAGYGRIKENPDPALPKVDDKYYILLQNRQSHTFNFNALEIGALNIPFKYRTGKGIVQPTITTSIANISLYGGFQFGRIKYWYNKYETTTPLKWSMTVGGFAGFDKETLDKSNTLHYGAPLPDGTKHDLGVLHGGVAVLANIYDIRIGLHVGIDHGVGNYGSEWDYQDHIWFGVGFGFKLPLFQTLTN